MGLGDLLNEIADSISASEEKSQRLDNKQAEELKYLQKNDIPDSLEIFCEEVEMAKDIFENLQNATEDEIKAEEILEGGQVSEEVRNKLISSETELENIIEHFFKEVKELDNDAEAIQEQIGSTGNRSYNVDRFKSSRRDLNSIIKNCRELKEESNVMASRREVLKGLGGGLAGATALNGLSKGKKSNIGKMALKVENSIAKGSNQDYTDKEREKNNSEIKEKKGLTKEKLMLSSSDGGVSCEAEILRTSADSGLAMIKIVNNSNQSLNLDISMRLDNLSVSGRVNFSNSTGSRSIQTVNLNPGKIFMAGALFYNSGGTPGKVRFRLEGGLNVNEDITLDVPDDIIQNHLIMDTDQIKEINLSHGITEKEGKRFLKIEVENASNSPLVTNITFGLPNGWQSSGGTNWQQSSAGLINTQHNLNAGYRDSLGIYLSKNNSNASSVGSLSLTVSNPENPSQESHYLVPVPLENLNR